MKSKEISQNCLTNKGENAIMKIITVRRTALVYHEEKGFDRKIRERRLCFREPAAGVSRYKTADAVSFQSRAPESQ